MNTNPARRITIRDVAAEAGVAISTVSAALSGDGRVKEETRERVAAVAKRLDYRPNKAAAMLSSREYRDPRTVAAVPVAMLTAMKEGDRHAGMDTVEGAKRRAEELGYAFRHVELGGERSVRALGRNLYARGVEGIIVGRMWRESPRTREIPWENCSVVYCGRDHAAELRAHGVEHDIFESTLRMFREATARGYKRVGFCLREHEPRLLDDDARLGAVLAGQAALPAGRRVAPYRGAAGATGREEMRRVMAWVEKTRPDAIVGFHHGDYWLLKDGGVKIPEEVGYADLHATAPGSGPGEAWISGIEQDRRRIGAAAMDLLDQQIRYRHRGLTAAPLSMLTYSVFHDGATLPRREGGGRKG